MPRDPAVTSRMMRAVKSQGSRAEMALRRELHRRGHRYRLHARDVDGTPDIVWRGRKIAVFVDGDMWHGNEHRRRGLERLEDLFPNRTEWWVAKIKRNMERDREVTAALEAAGWTVVRIWESEVLDDPASAADRVADALRQSSREGSIE
jgi:DNA mismatch endonuclease, patch repair protein